MAARRGYSRFQNEFLVTIGTFDFPVFELQKDLRMAQRAAAAIAGHGDFFDFDSFGRFGRLRHSVFASQKR